MTDPALELAQMINSTPEFTRRINDFVKAKKDAEEAARKHDEARAAADRSTAELNRKLEQHRADMVAATKKHDEAAAEAARRIELAGKLDDKNLARQQSLDVRETELKERESVVELLKGQFTAAIKALGKL